MNRIVCLAACAVVMMGLVAHGATLTMSITGPSSVAPGAEVNFQIRAMLGPGSDGLALIGVDLAADGFTLAPLTPGADMSSFVKVEGLTNPGGYGGTLSGGALLQIGGGQNTIGYSTDDPAYPNPDYPIGDVVLSLGDEAEVIIAEGTVTAPMEDGDYTLTISNAFANTIDEGEAEAPYAVSAVDEPIIYTNDGVLTVTVGGPSLMLLAAESIGTHTGYGDIGFPIDLVNGLMEPRVQSGGQLWIQMQFDQNVADVSALSVSVMPLPGVGFGLADGVAGDAFVELRFDADVPNDRYEVTVEGNVFYICYHKGDANCDGRTTGLDLGAIQSPSQWERCLDTAGVDARNDINRDGCVTGLDLGQVQSPSVWNQPSEPLACTCPE